MKCWLSGVRLDEALRVEDQPRGVRARILARSATLLLETGNTGEAERRAREALAVLPWNTTAKAVLHRIGRVPD
ncbi:MAG TPA: hypothetical protein ENK19_01820 [Acidobacteria bacterium]|nr:hypothetical protein [Acidobacteriota bacterium]